MCEDLLIKLIHKNTEKNIPELMMDQYNVSYQMDNVEDGLPKILYRKIGD